jgi:hypothetical protein
MTRPTDTLNSQLFIYFSFKLAPKSESSVCADQTSSTLKFRYLRTQDQLSEKLTLVFVSELLRELDCHREFHSRRESFGTLVRKAV